PGRPRFGENGCEVLEHAARLRDDVSLADDVAVLVEGDLPRSPRRVPAADRDAVAVSTSSSERIGIEEPPLHSCMMTAPRPRPSRRAVHAVRATAAAKHSSGHSLNFAWT